MTVFFSQQFWRPTGSDPEQISLLHFPELYEKPEPYYQQWPLVFICFLGSLEWIWLSLSWSSDVLYWLRWWIFIWWGIAGPHSSTLAWRLPWTEEPGRLQSMGSLRVGHDWATSLSCIGEGNGNPLQCSCLENPRDGGAWWAAVYGVTQSQTQLKRQQQQQVPL